MDGLVLKCLTCPEDSLGIDFEEVDNKLMCEVSITYNNHKNLNTVFLCEDDLLRLAHNILDKYDEIHKLGGLYGKQL